MQSSLRVVSSLTRYCLRISYPRSVKYSFARLVLSPVGGNSKTSGENAFSPDPRFAEARTKSRVNESIIASVQTRLSINRQIGYEEEQRKKREEKIGESKKSPILLDEATSVNDCRNNIKIGDMIGTFPL